MSENPETPDASDDPFDAFRTRRAEERAANESADQYATQQYMAGPYEPGQYEQPIPGMPGDGDGRGRGRGRLRSVAVFGGAAVLVAGVVGGVYAATRPSGSPAAATPPSVTASASASPSAGAPKDAKNGRAVTARLTVTSVAADSFTATTAAGQTVSVHITAKTKFGTATRPFTRTQLVTGAVVYARLRKEADGTAVATVIASATAASATASATPGGSV